MTTVNLDSIFERRRRPNRTKRVIVRSHLVRRDMWNDLAMVTNERILKLKPHPPGWCVYLNPGYTVEAPEFSLEFTQEARKWQGAWIRAMGRTLGNSNRKHFAIHADFLTRQLAHSGMLIVNGNVVPPHDWKSMEEELQFPVASQSAPAADLLESDK